MGTPQQIVMIFLQMTFYFARGKINSGFGFKPQVTTTQFICDTNTGEVIFEQKQDFRSILFPSNLIQTSEAVEIQTQEIKIDNDEDALTLFKTSFPVSANFTPVTRLAMQIFAHSQMGSSVDELTNYREKTDPHFLCVSKESKEFFTEKYILGRVNEMKKPKKIKLGHVRTKYLTNKIPSALFPAKNHDETENLHISPEMVLKLTNLKKSVLLKEEKNFYTSFLLKEACWHFEPLKNLTLSLFQYDKFQKYQSTSAEIVAIYKNACQMAFHGAPTFHNFPFIFTHILYSSKNPLILPHVNKSKGPFEGRGVIQLTTRENYYLMRSINSDCPILSHCDCTRSPYALDYFEFQNVFAQIRFLVKWTEDCETLKDFLDIVKPAEIPNKRGGYTEYGNIFIEVYSEFVRSLILANRILGWNSSVKLSNFAPQQLFQN